MISVNAGVAAADAYDFGTARFDLHAPGDREILAFVLSQVLYGEATAVYCGKSIYSAVSLKAAHFYVRQARQEFAHLKLFADIARELELTPSDGHWVLKLLSSHNNYYPLKVLAEHALGEGMVLDVFKDVLLQTLPDSDPRVPSIKKKLRVICQEEEEHVAWGEQETVRILAERPELKLPFFGLLELELSVIPLLARRFRTPEAQSHPVLVQIPAFLEHVRRRVWAQGQRLGFVPAEPPSTAYRARAIAEALAMFVRSQFARPTAPLLRNYLKELGF
jgi:hypothetical protein